MSGKSSRTKGHSFERRIANKLKKLWPEARRGLQYRDGAEAPDVVVPAPLFIECKAHAVASPKAALQQALDKSGNKAAGYPVAVTKDDYRPVLVTMLFEDWYLLVEAWERIRQMESRDETGEHCDD